MVFKTGFETSVETGFALVRVSFFETGLTTGLGGQS